MFSIQNKSALHVLPTTGFCAHKRARNRVNEESGRDKACCPDCLLVVQNVLDETSGETSFFEGLIGDREFSGMIRQFTQAWVFGDGSCLQSIRLRVDNNCRG